MLRIFISITVVLFGSLAAFAAVKHAKKGTKCAESKCPEGAKATAFTGGPIEIDIRTLTPKQPEAPVCAAKSAPVAAASPAAVPAPAPAIEEVNRVHLLFQKNSPLPIVETIRYKSHVPWRGGKKAWLVDYAQQYQTCVDFIIRSINTGAKVSSSSMLAEGQEMNILSPTRKFSFYSVIDVSRCMLWLYYLDKEAQEHFLLKTYHVSLGKKDASKPSGSLTPLGTFLLGKRVAVFTPKMYGMYRSKRVELITVFGTRWIPFDREVTAGVEPAKGYGIHGVPWVVDEKKQALVEDASSIGNYQSDGCIRLNTQDIEELYSIISTRESTIEIVDDVAHAHVPFQEKKGVE